METAGYILLSIGGGLIVILFPVILLIRRFGYKLANWWSVTPAVLWPPVLGLLLVITGTSLLVQVSKFWFFLYYPIQLVLFGLYAYSLYLSTSNRRLARYPDWLRKIWNVEKAFGGSIFGDLANTIGVMAGVGAYQLSNQEEGWFWLGQFGAFLAMLVGLSLAMRWIEGASGLINSDPRMDRWTAVGNFAVGTFTLLALMSPVEGSEALARGLGWKIPWLIFMLLAGINIIGFIWWFFVNRTGRPSTHQVHAYYIPWILLLLLSFGGFAALLVFQFEDVPKLVQYLFGMGAILSWGAIEVGAIIKIWGDRAELAKSLRSWMIVLGNVAMLYLVSWLFFEDTSSFGPVHWILFTEAVLLTTTATLMGIHLGIRALEHKPAAETA